MKRRPLAGIILIILIGLAVWHFGLYKRQARSDQGILSLYGNVDIRQVNLGFQVGGRIKAMPFEEGDTIHTGQVLGRLDPILYRETLRLNEAQLGMQSANLSKLLAGTRREEIAQNRASVAEREAELDNAETLLAKDRAAVQVGAVSRQDYQNALAQRDAAAARLEAARQALEEAVNGPRIQDIQAARANVKSAQASVSQAKTQLGYVSLVALADGIIQTRVQEPGAVVQPGETVYTVALLSPKWVQTYLEEPDLGRVKPGMNAEIYTDTDPKHPFSGQIGYIAPEAEFTPKSVETQDLRTALVYPMRVIVRDPENSLRQGMPVTVRIRTDIPHATERKPHG